MLAATVLLAAAEGKSEDNDPGAVFSYDVVKRTLATLGILVVAVNHA